MFWFHVIHSTENLTKFCKLKQQLNLKKSNKAYIIHDCNKSFPQINTQRPTKNLSKFELIRLFIFYICTYLYKIIKLMIISFQYTFVSKGFKWNLIIIISFINVLNAAYTSTYKISEKQKKKEHSYNNLVCLYI